jgi:hypothetical protein
MVHVVRIATTCLLAVAPLAAQLAWADNGVSDSRRGPGSHAHRPIGGAPQQGYAPRTNNQPNVPHHGWSHGTPHQHHYQRSPYSPPLTAYSPPLVTYPAPRIQPRPVYVPPPVYYSPPTVYNPNYAPPATYYNSAPVYGAAPYAGTTYAEGTDPNAPVVRYYCQDNQLYYPDTPSCTSSWLRVLVDPLPQ